MILYYRLEGKIPIPVNDIRDFEKFFTRPADRIVRQTKFPNDVLVSTVFLGIDHNWHGGEPILFETMVFGGKNDGYQKRYHTWDEALNGHQEVVNEVILSKSYD